MTEQQGWIAIGLLGVIAVIEVGAFLPWVMRLNADMKKWRAATARLDEQKTPQAFTDAKKERDDGWPR